MIYSPQTESLLKPYLEKGFHELDFSTYLKTFGASSHGLMDIRRSPKFYKWRRENQVTSRSMGIGTLVHMLVLEPGLFEQRVKIEPRADRRTKEGKAVAEAFRASLVLGDIAVDPDDYETLMHIKKALNDHGFAKEVLAKPGGTNEQSGFWIHDGTQAFC